MEIVVIGAGWHGGEIYSYLQDLSAKDPGLRVAGFIDEQKPRGKSRDIEVLGSFQDLDGLLKRNPSEIYHYITAAGDNETRRRFVEKITSIASANLHPWSLVHPKSTIGHDVEIGDGTCLAPGSIVTTHVRIGSHCLLNVKASVSHDCVLGQFVNLNPGATVAGNVRIGEGAFIGAGATVIDKVAIGEWSIVGAGAVVVQDVPPHVTVVGVPARVIRRHEF